MIEESAQQSRYLNMTDADFEIAPFGIDWQPDVWISPTKSIIGGAGQVSFKAAWRWHYRSGSSPRR